MDDLINKLTNILNTKEGQEQLKNLQSVLAPNDTNNSLSNSSNNSNNQNQNGFDMSALTSMLGGIMGSNNNNNVVQPVVEVQENVINNFEQNENHSTVNSTLNDFPGNKNNIEQQPNVENNNGFDMSALNSMLGGLMGNNNNSEQNNNGFDMSALNSMLGSLMGNNNNTQQNNNGFDMSALNSMLGGNNEALGGIDMNMILNLQKIFAGLNKNDKNTQLLLALKPHLSEQRCKKVDHAISFLRLFAMLPALKESGIFKGL